MTYESFIDEITAHLQLVEQLSVHIRADSDEALQKLDKDVGRFLNDVVDSVTPVLGCLDQTEFRIKPNFDREIVCRGLELDVPEYQLSYHWDETFSKVVVTTEGKMVTNGSRWTPSSPWYFLTLVRAAPIERLNFVIIFLGSLVSLIKEKLPEIEEKREQSEQASAWLAKALQILHVQAPN